MTKRVKALKLIFLELQQNNFNNFFHHLLSTRKV